MVLEVEQKQNINTISPLPPAEVATKPAAHLPIVEEIEAENSNVTFNTDNESNSKPKSSDKRTAKELYNALSPLLSKYGVSLSETEGLALLERVAGCSQEILLKLDNAEIKKHLECLEAGMKKLSKNGEKIDINVLGELANDYNIAIHTGWTIEEFEEAQSNGQESLKTRLERVYPGKSMEEALELYFNNFLKEKSDKVQLRDFGRLLANSSDEERLYFKEIVKTLHANNRLKGFDALLKSLDNQATRTNLVDSCGPEYVADIAMKSDSNGNFTDKKDVTAIATMIAREQSFKGRTDFHNKFNKEMQGFFEENKDIIAKIENGESLTPEEQKIKDKLENFFKSVAVGEFYGTASNVVIDENEKYNLLEKINVDTYSVSEKYSSNFYKNVLQGVGECSESLPEIKPLMDEVTSGNFSAVVNNGVESELQAPVTLSERIENVYNPTSVQGDFGFVSREYTDVVDLNQNVLQLYMTNSITAESPVVEVSGELETDKKVKDIIDVAKGHISQFTEFVRNNSLPQIIVSIFNNLKHITNKSVLSFAKEQYARFPRDMQEKILRNVASPEGFVELLNTIPPNVLVDMNLDFFNTYKDDLFKKAQQDAKKKLENQNSSIVE